MTNQITFTLIDAIVPKTLAKEYSLQDDKLCKTSVLNLSEGRATIQHVANLEDFGVFLSHLNISQVLMYGVEKTGADTLLVTQKHIERHPDQKGAVARTAGAFGWPKGGAIMMIDVDHEEGRPEFTPQKLVKNVRRAVPELRNASLLHQYSSSSMIFGNDGKMYAGARGHRLYVAVKEGSDIPRVAAEIETRLWAAGHGFIKISKSGALLNRTLIDSCVFQTNRIDLAAGAKMSSDLTQRRGAPRLFKSKKAETKFFDSRTQMPEADRATLRRADLAKREARRLAAPEAAKQKAVWKQERIVRQSIANSGLESESVSTLEAALENSVLCSDFIITVRPRHSKEFEEVTVAEILADVAKYDLAVTRDPIEPDYRDGAPVGKLYLRSGRRLFSYARGGTTYLLSQPKHLIELQPGETDLATDMLCKIMQDSGSFFDQGDVLVTVDDGRPYMLDLSSLSYVTAKLASFTKLTRSGKPEKIDPPEAVMRQLLSLNRKRRLPILLGTCNTPILSEDGTVMSQAGYHQSSGIYGDFNETAFKSIQENPSSEDCRIALELLLAPFSEIDFEDESSKSVLLAAAFTAICRASIDKSPAFIADAASPGAGKSMLCEAIGYLMIGSVPKSMPPLTDGNEDEIRKRTTAALLPPGEQVLFFDNQNGRIDSRVLSQLLTSAVFTDRILGLSRMASDIPNRALILMSGNNIEFSEELARRVLQMRVSVDEDGVFRRQFGSDVVKCVAARREDMVIAGLTLMSAALKSRSYSGPTVPSYPQWDRMVRQTILWINEKLGENFTDPLEVIKGATETATDQIDLYPLLSALNSIFSDSPFTAADALSRMDNTLEAELRGLTGSYGTPSPRAVGIHLSRIRDRRIGNFILRRRFVAKTSQYHIDSTS